MSKQGTYQERNGKDQRWKERGVSKKSQVILITEEQVIGFLNGES
jgi:hypothetical protein